MGLIPSSCGAPPVARLFFPKHQTPRACSRTALVTGKRVWVVGAGGGPALTRSAGFREFQAQKTLDNSILVSRIEVIPFFPHAHVPGAELQHHRRHPGRSWGAGLVTSPGSRISPPSRLTRLQNYLRNSRISNLLIHNFFYVQQLDQPLKCTKYEVQWA